MSIPVLYNDPNEKEIKRKSNSKENELKEAKKIAK
jgi:hypothetical protein